MEEFKVRVIELFLISKFEDTKKPTINLLGVCVCVCVWGGGVVEGYVFHLEPEFFSNETKIRLIIFWTWKVFIKFYYKVLVENCRVKLFKKYFASFRSINLYT
jgi:hypothetical protein